MPDKEKKPEFVVTDRRLFSTDGELRQDVVEAEERRAEREQEKREAHQRLNEELAAQRDASTATETAPPPQSLPEETEFATEAPTADEQHASAEAYKRSTAQVDNAIRKELVNQGQAHRAGDFEMTFEKFISSLYMTALLQLGLAAPQGDKPQVDLMGARQTIDVIGILQEKTKGNLTATEENILQNMLYELRMAYLEVTHLLTHPPQGGKQGNQPKA